MTAIAIINRDIILARVATGEYLASIAQSLNLAGQGQAISNELAQDPDYQAAKELGIECRLAQRERELENTFLMPDVTRARELLSHTRWRAERECAHRWGQKNQLHVSGTLTLSAVLAQMESEPAIDAQVVDSSVDK